MSSTRQATERRDSLTLGGNLPDLTPLSHVVRPTGIRGGMPRLRSPIIWKIRTKPVDGREEELVMR